MNAIVTLYNDNGNPIAAYDLKPQRVYNNGISTKYVFAFEFEYNHLNVTDLHLTLCSEKPTEEKNG